MTPPPPPPTQLLADQAFLATARWGPGPMGGEPPPRRGGGGGGNDLRRLSSYFSWMAPLSTEPSQSHAPSPEEEVHFYFPDFLGACQVLQLAVSATEYTAQFLQSFQNEKLFFIL